MHITCIRRFNNKYCTVYGSEILMSRKYYKLICKAKDRDIDAFLKLMSKYYEIVYTITYNKTTDEDSAKSMAHEVFINAFREFNSIDGEYSMIQLLFKLTNEICIKASKKASGKKARNIVK